jgi:two-component system LytT family response regulator
MTPALSILIVDDEPLARLKLRQLLEPMRDVRIVGECASGSEARRALERTSVDAMLLDVQMPGLSGLELVDAIPTAERPFVIFVTAFDQFAVHAFELHAVDYLLKPVREDRLVEAISRVQALRAANEREEYGARLAAAIDALRAGQSTLSERLAPRDAYLDVIQVDLRDRAVFLRAAEIDWIEGADNYVRLHVGGESYLHRATLRELEDRLDPRAFVRVHRSALVNLGRVQEKSVWGSGDHLLRLTDGTTVKLSRSYRDEFDARTGRPGRNAE